MVPMYNLLRNNEYFVLSLAVGKNDMMIKMFDKPNTTPVGQDRETNFDLQSFALFRCSYSRVRLKTVLRGVQYIPLFSLVIPL